MALVRAAFLLALLLTACGGGSDTVAPPPPPPPGPNNTPSSVAIAAGDNQEGQPGLPLPVHPAAIVKNSAGAPLAGVAVSFTVQSGGGSIAAGSATTGGDGVATAGDWTLGPSDGENTLAAAVGGLPPATFHAQGRTIVRVVADTTLGPGGGTITVTRPGDPANGAAVTVPAGMLTNPTEIMVKALPPLALTLPDGVTPVGPPLELAGFPAAYTDSVITVRIPAVIPAGDVAAAFLRDPATGRLEMLAPVSQDPAFYTGATRHLSPDLMMGATVASAVRGSRLRVGGVVQVLVLAVSRGRLANGVDSHFRPGTDDFEFPNLGSYIAVGGHCAGQSIAAMYYYLRWKSIKGSLFGHFDDNPTIWPDNPRMYRFASVVHNLINWDARQRFFAATDRIAAGAGISRDELNYNALALAILTTGQPQYVSVRTTTEGHAIIGYRVEPGRVLVADPNFPGEEHEITFANGAFQPYTSKARADSAGVTFNLIRTVGVTIMVPTASLDAAWGQVENRTIGNSEFPAWKLEYYDALADEWDEVPDTLRIRQDRITFRGECPACIGGISGGKLEWLRVINDAGQLIADGQTKAGADAPIPSGTSRLGFWVQGDPTTKDWDYLDYQWRHVISTPFGVSPDTARAYPDSVVSFAARPYGDMPAGSRFVWNFGDGTPFVTVVDDSTVTHVFPQPSIYTVKVTLQNASGKSVAAANAIARIIDPWRWQLTALSGSAPAWSPVSIGNVYQSVNAFFQTLVGNPANGVVHLDAVSGRVKLSLEPPVPGQPAFVTLAGRDASGCDVTNGSTMTGDYASGSLTGQWVYNCAVGFNRSVSSAILRINATKQGDVLTGTMTAEFTDFDGHVETEIVGGKVISKFYIDHILGTQTVTYTFSATR